jgi:hypothetical protein
MYFVTLYFVIYVCLFRYDEEVGEQEAFGSLPETESLLRSEAATVLESDPAELTQFLAQFDDHREEMIGEEEEQQQQQEHEHEQVDNVDVNESGLKKLMRSVVLGNKDRDGVSKDKDELAELQSPKSSQSVPQIEIAIGDDSDKDGARSGPLDFDMEEKGDDVEMLVASVRMASPRNVRDIVESSSSESESSSSVEEAVKNRSNVQLLASDNSVLFDGGEEKKRTMESVTATGLSKITNKVLFDGGEEKKRTMESVPALSKMTSKDDSSSESESSSSVHEEPLTQSNPLVFSSWKSTSSLLDAAAVAVVRIDPVVAATKQQAKSEKEKKDENSSSESESSSSLEEEKPDGLIDV